MRKVVLTGALTVILVLTLTGVALAATPWDIYEDYSADGRLDGTYTDSELRAYLNSAYVDQYGDLVIITALDTVVRNMLAARDRFPFTGMELGLIVMGVVAVAGTGLALRRSARLRRT
jgi:hypothetical protein